MDEARAALTSSSGARKGSNCDFTLPLTPRSSNALRPPRKSDPEYVRLWKVCGVPETGGERVHPGSSRAELTCPFPPEPSTFRQERQSSRSRFSTREGNGQHRRNEGTTQHGTVPSRRDPRDPSATSARPGRAEPQSRARSPAHFSAPGTAEAALASSAGLRPAWLDSARLHSPTWLCTARPGSRLPQSQPPHVASGPAPPRPRLLQLLLL